MISPEEAVVRNRPLLLVFFAVGLSFLAFLLSSCGGGEPKIIAQAIKAAEGGTVALGQEVVLRIPPGVLPADATVRIAEATEEHPGPRELRSLKAVGPAFNIDLGGQELTKPVTLEIAYDPSLLPEGAPEDAVFAAYYDESLGWVGIASGRVDSGKHVIVVDTNHLSWWQPSTWWGYDAAQFERPRGCWQVDEGRNVCFEHYLHNDEGFRLDPVNLIFVGRTAYQVAQEIDQRLNWGQWCDVSSIVSLTCTPLRLSINSHDLPPDAQRKELQLARRGYHIRLYQSAYPDVVLGSVHDDEAECFIAIDVGRNFDEARNVVADAFANEYQIESLSLGNTLSTAQCFGTLSTASNDGKAVIIRLDRPTLEPPSANPVPGSCAIFEEKYCRLGKLVDFKDPYAGTTTKLVGFLLPEGVTIFAPFRGEPASGYGGHPLNARASDISMCYPSYTSDRGFLISGDLRLAGDFPQANFYVDLEALPSTGPFSCQLAPQSKVVERGEIIGWTTATGIRFFRDTYNILISFTYLVRVERGNGGIRVITATDEGFLGQYFPDLVD